MLQMSDLGRGQVFIAVPGEVDVIYQKKQASYSLQKFEKTMLEHIHSVLLQNGYNVEAMLKLFQTGDDSTLCSF